MICSQLIQIGEKLREQAIERLTLQLAVGPQVRLGRHKRNGRWEEVIRISENGRTRELAVTGVKGRRLAPVARKSRVLKETLQKLKRERGMPDKMSLKIPLSEDPMPVTNSKERYSYEVWSSLVEANDTSIKNGYAHGRRVFRSKSEMLIAQILEMLGLEYKYEPLVTINGEEKWPDFAVYCPETGRFFFIEHLGMMDKMNYRMDNLDKMEKYENAGIRNGVDILYTTEFGKGMFDTRAILGKIFGIIVAQSQS